MSVRLCSAGRPDFERICSTRSLPPALAGLAGLALAFPVPRSPFPVLLGMRGLVLPGLVAERRGLDAALARDALHGHEVPQPVHRGADHVVRVVGPEAL